MGIPWALHGGRCSTSASVIHLSMTAELCLQGRDQEQRCCNWCMCNSLVMLTHVDTSRALHWRCCSFTAPSIHLSIVNSSDMCLQERSSVNLPVVKSCLDLMDTWSLPLCAACNQPCWLSR